MTIINTKWNTIIIGIAVMLTLLISGCSSSRQPTQFQFGTGNYTPGSPEEFAGGIGNKVYFETDSSNLTQEARIVLDRQAQWLNQYPTYSVRVEGHADERGTREYNIALGARRATATKDYLVAKGVSGTRFSTISFGKEKPIAVCNDISCWSQNRRSVTQVSQ